MAPWRGGKVPWRDEGGIAVPTFTWNGATAAFMDPANWTPAGVPRADDTAVIASGVAAIAGLTLDSVRLQLGGAGTTGALAASATAGSSFAGAITQGVIDAAGAGAGGRIDVAGEFDLSNESTLAASNGADLTVTLAPASNGALGVLLAAQPDSTPARLAVLPIRAAPPIGTACSRAARRGRMC